MATISDIQQVASYRGDANLGGGNVGVIDPRIDTRAWQRLADFTFIKNKAEYERQRQEFDGAVAAAAKDLSVDWSKILPKHRERILNEREELKKFAREHPDSWSQNSKYFGELQAKKNEFLTSANAAISRGLEFEVGMEQGRKKALSSEDMAAYEKEMNNRVGGIFDKISPFAEFNLTPLNLAAGQEKISTDKALPNFVETTSGQVTDMAQVWSMAGDLPIEKDLRPGMNKITAQKAMADGFNQVVSKGYMQDPKYAIKNADGSVGFTALARGDQSVIGQLVRDVEMVNEEIRKYNSVNPNSQVPTIDPANGIDEVEANAILIFKKSLAARTAANASTSLKFTGRADDLYMRKLEEWGRNKRSADQIAADIARDAAKGNTSAQALETDATTFAKRIDGLVVGNTGREPMISLGALSPEDKRVLGLYDKDNKPTGKLAKMLEENSDLKESDFVFFKGPGGGYAISKVNEKGRPSETIDSYSFDGLRSARLSFWVREGAGKEMTQSAELNPRSPATTGETEAQRFLRESQ